MSPNAAVAAPPATPATPDLRAVKARQQATWASGDFAVIGVTLQSVGESLADAADVGAGERVLDVAAGNGNATLAAARRYAEVTSTDYVPHLLDKGRARASAEGLEVTFQAADAEQLPFADASFDVALSTFGVMFAPDHRQAARELRRVVRPGGRIGLANWTPEGFIGEVLRVVAKHVPPPAGVASPMLWGTRAHLKELFGADAADIRIERKNFDFRYRSPAHWIQVFREFYGPTHKAFLALDEAARGTMHRELEELLVRRNVGRANTLKVPGEYLEVVITRR
jgi:SAM-dependent methyltransferase